MGIGKGEGYPSYAERWDLECKGNFLYNEN